MQFQKKEPSRPSEAQLVRYPRAMVVLHWLVAGIIVLQLFVAVMVTLLQHVTTMSAVMDLHRSIGLTIFVLMVARLALRLRRPIPTDEALPAWQRYAAAAVHGSFYVVLLVAPIVGWLYSNAVGQSVSFFWILPLPALVDPSAGLADRLLTAHVALAVALVFLIGLHSCGAFYNRLILKNRIFDKILLSRGEGKVSAHISIWSKLLLGGAASLALALTIGVTGLTVSRTLGAQGLDMYDGVLQSTSYVRSAQVSFERFVTEVQAVALARSAKINSAEPGVTAHAAHDAIKKALEETQSDLDVALERIGDPAVAASTKRVKAKVVLIGTPLETWRSNAAAGLPSELAGKFGEVRADLAYLAEDVAALGFTMRSDMEGEASFANDVMLLTMLAALICSGVIIVLTAGTVSRQVRQAALVARRIAGGDYDTPLAVSGKTEMANLLRALDEMRQAINNQLQRLDKARKESEAANKLKSQFLANMSHEIRTPMNGVMGMAQLLMKTTLDEKQTRFARTVLSSSRALLGIINDILDLSKIEAGSMTLDIGSIDMKSMVEETMGRVEGVAAQKRLKIGYAIAPARLGTFSGDSQRLIQVLVNLLGNAIKFTDHGEVMLEVAAGKGGGTNFSVRDTGPGIPADQISIVFERFRQVDGTSTRKHGGTGLGLAITKELVDLMKGDVGLESTVGVGTTFWVELPLTYTRAAVAEASDEPAEAPEVLTRGMRVLVAEDNETNQMLVEEILKMLGMNPKIVANGRLALEALEEEMFDLVLMDIHMPEMDGDIAIQRIRACGKSWGDVPIIVVTASAMKGMAERYLELGADGYVPKPIEIPRLTAAINNIFDRRLARVAA